MSDRDLTVRQYAYVENVTTRTVRTWIAKGAVPTRRTPGGGVRVVTTPSPAPPPPSHKKLSR